MEDCEKREFWMAKDGHSLLDACWGAGALVFVFAPSGTDGAAEACSAELRFS